MATVTGLATQTIIDRTNDVIHTCDVSEIDPKDRKMTIGKLLSLPCFVAPFSFDGDGSVIPAGRTTNVIECQNKRTIAGWTMISYADATRAALLATTSTIIIEDADYATPTSFTTRLTCSLAAANKNRDLAVAGVTISAGKLWRARLSANDLGVNIDLTLRTYESES